MKRYLFLIDQKAETPEDLLQMKYVIQSIRIQQNDDFIIRW